MTLNLLARDAIACLMVAWLIRSFWSERHDVYRLHGERKGRVLMGGMIVFLLILGVLTLWSS